MAILAMEEEEEEHIRISSSSSSLPNSNSMESATVGLVMNTLLTARPKKLQEAISCLDSAPKKGPIGVSLEQSLWILHMYIKDEAGKGEPLDQVLVPMIEHSLKCKGSKNNNRAMILLNWLFQDEFYFRSLATNLANILVRKDDNFIALGWCILGRSLIEYEIAMNQLLTNGIKEKRNALLKILCSCVTHLLSIIRHGSTLQDGFEFPTRLSVAAADFIIALTVALTRKEMVSNIPNNQTKSSINPELKNISGVTAIGRRKVKPLSVPSESSSEMEMKLLLWNLLDELTVLMQKLVAWNKKSRPMHAEGLERVVMWLQETKRRYGHFQEVAGSQMVKTGTLLLSSCWKYYGVLLHLEDPKISHQYRELLDQYLSGIEFYADNYAEDGSENKESGIETINFFLSCLLLLLGRLDAKQFENVMSEYGARISSVLILQLRSGDEDVINGAVFLIKSAIFTTNNSLSRSSLIDNVHMNALLPSLLHLLDEQDGTARAAIMLIAEYCFMSSDNKCLEEVLKRLTTGEVVRRKNAVDVIAEVVRISSDSVEASLSHSTWEDIAEHLLDCLGDEDMVIGERASKLIPMLDASLVLPSLIRCIYLSNERVELSASTTLVAVLQYHNQKFDVICMLLDCLSNLSQMLNRPDATDDQLEGLKFDTDKVLKLIPEWSKSVEDWNLLIKPLIKKMFSEPSNATIVRFLSYISEHLADNADEVFTSLLLHTGKQKEMDKYLFPECDAGRSHTEGVVELQQSLFSRLCPLLILRLLPLRVFNNVKSSLLYGEILSQQSDHDNRYFSIHEIGGVAALLLNSAFNKFEFEDVRKLAAELCGRIHPQVLFPFISSQLGHAVNSHDILKIKASLFSICTSLVVRGTESLWHPDVLEIRKTIETILLWPSTDGDEISKAQHGCIDCLALMVCTEMQAIKSSTESNFNKTSIPAKNCSGNSSSPGSPHAYILHQLISDKEELIRSTNFGTKNSTFSETVLSYRLCMANVLISACQKVSTPGRKSFAKTILPLLIKSIRAIKESEVRAACIQVLFSAVYHLKSAVSSCSPDLLKVAIKSLKDGSEKERVAGAKLMASLMASEDVVLQSISGGLIEAAPLLSTLSSSDSSPDLRHVCQKLLLCMTSQ